jgi:hypothetical protein
MEERMRDKEQVLAKVTAAQIEKMIRRSLPSLIYHAAFHGAAGAATAV